ncbi:MAG: hypothetical protein YPKNTGVA_002545 [Candidatus Fervidibacter sp.]|jgi:hypothetical protein
MEVFWKHSCHWFQPVRGKGHEIVMANFLGAEFIRQKFCGMASPCQNFLRSGMNPNIQDNSPTEVGSQFPHHQLLGLKNAKSCGIMATDFCSVP